jgi:CubicO group peptidase (beta-lactamase class C family)
VRGDVKTLDDIAELVVRRGAAPSAAVAVAWRRGGAFELATGVAGGLGASKGAPIFDLASVTKPFVAVTAARLARRGVFRLDEPVGRLLSELAATSSGDLPLLAFLAHRSGLEAHRPLFAPLVEGRPVERHAMLAEAATARRPDSERGAPPGGEQASTVPLHPGFAPVYSDLGYLIVGAALERASGAPLDELVELEVCRPLSIEVRSAKLWLSASHDFAGRVEPTETVAFRGGELRGVTHDENAWAFAGHGLAGHAGLFGTAEGVLRFGAAVLDAVAGRLDSFLTAAETAPLVVPRPGGSLRAGFDGKSGSASAAGAHASAQTFGHLGFTGTSLWCERVTVLLSNRVCPTRDNLTIRALRPEIHDLLYEAVSALENP